MGPLEGRPFKQKGSVVEQVEKYPHSRTQIRFGKFVLQPIHHHRSVSVHLGSGASADATRPFECSNTNLEFSKTSLRPVFRIDSNGEAVRESNRLQKRREKDFIIVMKKLLRPLGKPLHGWVILLLDQFLRVIRSLDTDYAFLV